MNGIAMLLGAGTFWVLFEFFTTAIGEAPAPIGWKVLVVILGAYVGGSLT